MVWLFNIMIYKQLFICVQCSYLGNYIPVHCSFHVPVLCEDVMEKIDELEEQFDTLHKGLFSDIKQLISAEMYFSVV